MRAVIKLDTKIDKDEALALLDRYADFIDKHTGIKCQFYVERHDYSYVPTTPDDKGDLKPTFAYRQAMAKEVHDRYGDYGTDHIVMWVHDDNFLFRGVWGTAWASSHFKYMFELARWDKRNDTNTFNTLFHENGGHPLDTLIKTELGIEIDELIENHFGLENFDYDRDYVHGGSDEFQYIGRAGYKLDGRMLEFLAPYLRAAYASRKAKHEEYTKSLMKQVISLLRKKITLLLTRKDK